MFLDLNCFLVNELKGTALRSKNSKEKCLFKIPISIKGLNLITGHLLKSQGCDSVNLDPAILDKIIRMSSVLTLRVRNNLGWLRVSHWIDTLNLIISNQIEHSISLDWVCLFPIEFKDNPIVSTVWITGETGDINTTCNLVLTKDSKDYIK